MAGSPSVSVIQSVLHHHYNIKYNIINITTLISSECANKSSAQMTVYLLGGVVVRVPVVSLSIISIH